MRHLGLLIPNLRMGGAERIMALLANHWVIQGYQVSFFTLMSPDEKSFYDLDPRIQVLPFGKNLSTPLLSSPPFSLTKALYRLRRSLRQMKPDLLVSFMDRMNILTLLLSRGLNVPVIVSERNHPLYLKLSPLFEKLRQWTYPWVDQIVVQTQKVFQDMPWKDQMVVIPNPVQIPDFFKENYENNERWITVGRLDPQKNHSFLIKVFAKVCSFFPKATLTIYGEGPDRSKLEEEIRMLHLEGRVLLPGALSANAVQEVLCKADLFIFPSLYEGFPNALAEAMAVGLPVVASNVPGNQDLIQNHVNGLLPPLNDIEAWTSNLITLNQNQELRRKLGQGSRAKALEFSQESVLKQWDELLLKFQL